MLAGTQDAAVFPPYARQTTFADAVTIDASHANSILWSQNAVQVDATFPLPTVFAPGTWVIVAVMAAGGVRVTRSGAPVTINDSAASLILGAGVTAGAAMLVAETATNWSMIQLR